MRHVGIGFGLAAALLLATMGCSLAINGPPDGHEQMAAFTCDDRYTLAIIEGALGSTLLGLSLGTEQTYGSGAGAALGAVATVDALFVSFKVHACREALEKLRRRGPTPNRASMRRSYYRPKAFRIRPLVR